MEPLNQPAELTSHGPVCNGITQYLLHLHVSVQTGKRIC